MAKKFLATLAIVGAGALYYDQNVSPLFSRDDEIKNKYIQAKQEAKPADHTQKELRKLDEKARDFGSQLKTTANKSADDIRNKADSSIDSIKNSDLYNKWSKKLDSYSSDVERAAESVENKPFPERTAIKYIDFINGLGQTKDEKLDELASSTTLRQQKIKKDLNRENQSWSSWWSGKKDEAKDEVNKAADDAKDTKNSWFNWGSNKADDAKQKAEDAKKQAEQKKNSWISWGQDKKDEADKKAQEAKNDIKNQKDSWFSWGQDKKEEVDKQAQQAHRDLNSSYEQNKKDFLENYEAGKQKALDQYYEAKKNLDDLTKQASDKASTAWGKVEEQKDLTYLNKAKDDFLSALANLKNYGSDLVNEADRSFRGDK